MRDLLCCVELGAPVMTVDSIGKSKEETTAVASVVVIEASTFEEAKELVEADAFYKNNVVSFATAPYSISKITHRITSLIYLSGTSTKSTSCPS